MKSYSRMDLSNSKQWQRHLQVSLLLLKLNNNNTGLLVSPFKE